MVKYYALAKQREPAKREYFRTDRTAAQDRHPSRIATPLSINDRTFTVCNRNDRLMVAGIRRFERRSTIEKIVVPANEQNLDRLKEEVLSK